MSDYVPLAHSLIEVASFGMLIYLCFWKEN